MSSTLSAKAAGLLDRRASTQVHDALGQRGGPARSPSSLGDKHVRTGLGGAEGRGGPGGTKTDDHDVGRVSQCGLRRRRTASRRLASRTPSSLRVAETVAGGGGVPDPYPAPGRPRSEPRAGARCSRSLAPGWSAALVYRIVPGATTWRLTGPAGAVRYAKVATGTSCHPTLRDEADRMVWAAAYLPVPGSSHSKIGGRRCSSRRRCQGATPSHAVVAPPISQRWCGPRSGSARVP